MVFYRRLFPSPYISHLLGHQHKSTYYKILEQVSWQNIPIRCNLEHFHISIFLNYDVITFLNKHHKILVPHFCKHKHGCDWVLKNAKHNIFLQPNGLPKCQIFNTSVYNKAVVHSAEHTYKHGVYIPVTAHANLQIMAEMNEIMMSINTLTYLLTYLLTFLW